MKIHDFLLLFLLAHLIGDFVLQTDKLARIKSDGTKGLMLHSLIVTLVQVSILSLLGPNGILAALICGIIHLFIDYLKNALQRYLANLQFVYFILDQLVHFLILWVLSGIFLSRLDISLRYVYQMKLLIILIILTYISTVAVKILVRDVIPGLKTEDFFRKYERHADACFSVLLYMVMILIPHIYAVPLILLIFYPFILFQKNVLKYEIKAGLIKYAAYVSISLIAVCTQSFI